MPKTLRGQLVATFVLLALGGIAVINLVLNRSVDQRFDEYLRTGVQERVTRVAAALGPRYRLPAGWTEATLSELRHWSRVEGIDLTLEQPPGTAVWRSADTDPSEPAFTVAVPLSAAGSQVGLLRAAVSPANLYTSHDVHFRIGITRVMTFSAFGAVLLGLVAAWLVHRGIHRPLLAMTRVAEKMRLGDWSQRLPPVGAVELRQLAEALNHLATSLAHHDEMRRRMTRDVAHELRTPLAIVRSHLEALQEGIWSPTPEHIAVCHRETLRLVRLVDDLNELSEAESAALRLEWSETPLSALLDPLAASSDALFRNTGIAFAYRPVPGASVRVDREQMSRVFTNLLANAQKYTPTGGQVTLAATVGAGRVQVTVTDSGPGIPAADLPFIFERFYRGDRSRARHTGGAGLGLAIARTLTEAHGGRISVRNRPEGGAEFTVSLPGVSTAP